MRCCCERTPQSRHGASCGLARLNLIRDVLSRLHYAGKKTKLVQPDADIAFEFTSHCIQSQRLAR